MAQQLYPPPGLIPCCSPLISGIRGGSEHYCSNACHTSCWEICEQTEQGTERWGVGGIRRGTRRIPWWARCPLEHSKSSGERGTPCAFIWSLWSVASQAHGRGSAVGGCATIPMTEELLVFVLVKRCELPVVHQGDNRCI